jgi:hypothetical protein
MNLKTLIAAIAILAVAGLAVGYWGSQRTAAPVAGGPEAANEQPRISVSSNASLERLDLQALAKQADLVVIGTITDVGKPQWSAGEGFNADQLTAENLPADLMIFSDATVQIDQVLLGDGSVKSVAVRVFGGELDGVRVIVAPEPMLEAGSQYLMFLVKDIGSTAAIGQEHMIVLGSVQGICNLVDQQAVSQAEILASESADCAAAVTVIGQPADEFVKQVTELLSSR